LKARSAIPWLRQGVSRLCGDGDDGGGDGGLSQRKLERRTRGPRVQQRESSSWGESSTMPIVEIRTEGT
jgi:hypothetical protein